MDPTENTDLLEETPATEPTEITDGADTTGAPADDNAGDASPTVETDGAKSLLEALDVGLQEVEDRRNRGAKKPEESTAEETAEAKAAREAEEAANAGRERNADGTFKEAAAKPEEQKAAKEKAAIDDPIPSGVAEKTAERMKTLIDLVKDKDGQIAQAQQFVDQIAATGATPQEFSTMMSYMSAVHSDSPEHLKLARNLLQSELEAISLKLGEPAPGIDFLAKYPDLQAMVERGEVRRDLAIETAMNRTRAANQKQQTEAQRQQTETQAAATKAHNDGMAELNALGDELYARDGKEYLRRYAILEPALEALGQLPPAQWKAAFLRAYSAVKPAPAATVAATLNKGGTTAGGTPAAKPQPMRPNKTPSGESAGKPKSMLEAINQGLGEMNA